MPESTRREGGQLATLFTPEEMDTMYDRLDHLLYFDGDEQTINRLVFTFWLTRRGRLSDTTIEAPSGASFFVGSAGPRVR